jgi:hypothetical protein
VALAFVGFNWGGWVTGGTSESLAVTRTNVAVAEALGPMCVDKFKLASGAAANLEALKKADSWAQADMIEKGSWASVQGPKALDRVSAVATLERMRVGLYLRLGSPRGFEKVRACLSISKSKHYLTPSRLLRFELDRLGQGAGSTDFGSVISFNLSET